MFIPTTRRLISGALCIGRRSAHATLASAARLHGRCEVLKATLGPEHVAVATSRDNVADLYRKTGRLKEAEPLAARSKAIRGMKR